MKKSVVFDDQYQPMSSWLNDLAVKEASSFNDTDLKDDEVGESRKAEFKGISSTWNKKGLDLSKETVNDNSRQIENRIKVEASIDEIEKEARKLMMSGLNIEKISSKIKKQFDGENVNIFLNTKLAALENEFGKLGYVYLDPVLVDNCKSMLDLANVNQKVSSVTIQNIKTASKCKNCNYNKYGNCVLVGYKLNDNPKISSQQEAKFILNKFASLKYINGIFVKTAELVNYYNRLKTDDPEKVVSDFLIDVDNRRTSHFSEISNRRFKNANESTKLISAENRLIKLENKQAKEIWGKCDQELANAFKQLLVKTQSIRIAKDTISQRYGADRTSKYLKEAKDDLRKFVRFITSKKHPVSVRLSANNKNFNNGKISNVTKDINHSIKTEKALKVIYASVIFNKTESDTKKHMLRAFNESIVNEAFDIFAKEKGSKKQASQILCFSVQEKYLDNKVAKKILAKLDNSNNNLELVKKAFDISRNKKISENLKDQIINTALKYASENEISDIRKLSTKSWTKDELVKKVQSHLKFANYFNKDVTNVLNKSADEASTILQSVNLFTADQKQNDLPDPMLSTTF